MMKILHALVGYLAVTSLPFHPFTFAFPLAAIDDYDGYVNSTTSNHSDRALMKRVPGDIIEARQAAVIVPPVLIIVAIIAEVVLGIVWVEGDNPVRLGGNDVEFLVELFD